MQHTLDADALHRLSKEELVIHLLRARERINDLSAEVTTLRRAAAQGSHTTSPATSPTLSHQRPQAGTTAAAGAAAAPSGATTGQEGAEGSEYSVSLNVLNITGTPTQRICKSVPLQTILARSQNREDERDADTPVVGSGDGNARFSVEMGRFSGFSVGSDGLQLPDDMSPGGRPSEGGLSTLGGGSPQTDPARQPSTSLAGSASNPGMSRNASLQVTATGPSRGRPAPLLHVAGPLDGNAILSMNTLHAFRALQADQPASPGFGGDAQHVLHYIMDVFVKKNDFAHEEDTMYVEGLARAMLNMCTTVERIVKEEPAHPTVPSPAYVFGDIHGNFRDLHYFTTQLMIFDDLRFVPFRFLFLGDYVDRGDFSVECIAFLFALKALAPHKVTLLRGNHEDTLVNGDVNLYGNTSFRFQCKALFGELLGEKVWSRCNDVFSYLPLTANIDGKIFCTHGGLPRYSGGDDHRMEDLQKRLPPMRSLFEVPQGETPEHREKRQAATDVCWSDPAEDDRRMDKFGFGNNPRGNGVIMFGGAAVDDFLDRYGFEFIFRAHQEKADGLKISKNARVITIFSTSAYVGHQNGAGVVYVGDHRIRLIVKEPDEEDETMYT